ncbi:unnamed protein product [Cyclocybe aegerita]|uniref:ATP-dependent RNA helicase n=1 Tax=Cyclocybe aegerita TaxID=1973307 RepID=A0A8S0X676_CYCAE|nr:unnamed protein product [Cyclocybe aegerita]
MNLTHHHKGFQVQLLLGGESKGRQLREWRGRKDVVVATPGRLLDLLNSEDSVRDAIQHAKLLILDEADTLLDMGFKADIEMINSYLPPTPQRQTFLFSATVSRAIQEIARDTLSRSHKFVNCVSVDDSPVHAHIPQYHTVIPSGQDAFPHLLRLIAQDQLIKLASADKRGKSEPSKVIVFFNTTKMVQLFSDMLRQAQSALPLARQTRIYEIHSKRDMKQRVRVSDGFRHDKGPASVLVTSDVSARGVDYPGVTRVIQMGVPAGRDIYIHRVGRTGRAGKTDGRGDLVISSWELPFLKQMADVGLKPVTVAEVKRDVEERAAAVGVSSPHLASLDNHAMSISSATNAHEISEAYMSQLGFFLGHIQSLGLVQPDVVNGVGKYFQDLGALEAPPMMSRSMQERLRLGSAKYERKGQGNRGGFGGRGSYADRDRERGAGNRRPAWGTYASGKDFRGLGRHERERSPWESRGDSDRYAGFSRKGRDGARSNEGYGFSKDRGSRRNARFDEY